jgi:hypothetical protein
MKNYFQLIWTKENLIFRTRDKVNRRVVDQIMMMEKIISRMNCLYVMIFMNMILYIQNYNEFFSYFIYNYMYNIIYSKLEFIYYYYI